MTTAELVTWTLGVHGTLATLSLVGFYKYGDRTSMFGKCLSDVEDLLLRMRRRIAIDLGEELEPVFERAEGEPTLVLPSSYTEHATNPVGSDAYREAIRRFADQGGSTVLADYGRTLHAKAQWSTCARQLSWTMLVLLVWEIACAALFGVAGKMVGIDIAECVPKWSFAPTGVFVLAFLWCQAWLLRHHDVIQASKAKYDDV